MRAEQHLEASFRAVLKNMNLPWPDKAVIEPSKDPKHGDLASTWRWYPPRPQDAAARAGRKNGRSPAE